MKRPALLLALALMLAYPWSVQAQQAPGSASGRLSAAADTVWAPSPMGALLRSALLPGWGQLYVRQPLKAGIMLAGEGWFLLESMGADRRVQDLVAERAGTSDPIELSDLAQRLEVTRRRRTVWIRWSVIFWIFQFTDAYVDAHLFDFERLEPNVGMELEFPPGGGPGLMLRLTARIGSPSRGGGR